MHHAILDQWSRASSLLHARDARVKVLVLIAYLAALSATASLIRPLAALGFVSLAAACIVLSRLPAGGVLLRAAVVLPFSAVFAGFSLLAGDSERALALPLRTYLSAVAVLVLVGTTPLPALLRGLEALGVPRFLILVVHFLYRYLFVLSEQAQHMRLAAASRGSTGARRRAGAAAFRAAAGALAVLFARSHARAQAIHRAMLARGFQASITTLSPARMGPGDLLFLAAGGGACLGLALALHLTG